MIADIILDRAMPRKREPRARASRRKLKGFSIASASFKKRQRLSRRGLLILSAGLKRINGSARGRPLIRFKKCRSCRLPGRRFWSRRDARQMPRICFFLAWNSSSVSKPWSFITESF
jgi:hypothetical protein